MPTRRLPPIEVRPGETLVVIWPTESADVQVQLRVNTPQGYYRAHRFYSPDLFRRPPSVGVADFVRAELQADINSMRSRRRGDR